jgi:hypothetical protein
MLLRSVLPYPKTLSTSFYVPTLSTPYHIGIDVLQSEYETGRARASAKELHMSCLITGLSFLIAETLALLNASTL